MIKAKLYGKTSWQRLIIIYICLLRCCMLCLWIVLKQIRVLFTLWSLVDP